MKLRRVLVLPLVGLLLTSPAVVRADDHDPARHGAPAQAEEGHEHRHIPHQPQDHDAYMEMLERDARDGYQKPWEVVEALGLRAGLDVADIGAGSGYFTRRVASRVAPGGTVFALDIEAPFLDRIRRDARHLGLANVRTVLTSPERPDLPDDSVDLVLVVNTWHHIPNPTSYLAEIHRILRPGGRLVHIDWVKRETAEGPPLRHRIAREDLVREMVRAGFRLRTEHFFLPWHYFLVFDRPSPGEPAPRSSPDGGAVRGGD